MINAFEPSSTRSPVIIIPKTGMVQGSCIISLVWSNQLVDDASNGKFAQNLRSSTHLSQRQFDSLTEITHQDFNECSPVNVTNKILNANDNNPH